MKRPLVLVSVLALAFPLAAGSALGEESYKKYRFSLSINNYSSTDELRTNADNVSLFRNQQGGFTAVNDPRPDSAVKNTNSVKDDFSYDFQASYGLLRWRWAELTVDSGVGYFKGELGDLEVAGQYDLVDPPQRMFGEATRFHLAYITIGEVTEIPVQVGATMRFRPKKPLSPFLGAGVGYMFVDIEPTREFLQFSDNVRNSIGAHTRIVNGVPRAQPAHRMKAAEVETPDTFEYHVSGGLEWTFSKGLSAVVTGSWLWAQEKIDITIDGKHDFGRKIPNGDSKFEYPVTGLPVTVSTGQGGLVDFGSGFPYVDPVSGKHFVGPPDGLADSGDYYAQGGTLRYGGFEFGFGLRYQF